MEQREASAYSAAPIIEMKGIVKRFYIGQPNELEILRGIDLVVRRRGIYFNRRRVRFGKVDPHEYHRGA